MSLTLQISLGLVSAAFFISLLRRAFFIGRPGVAETWVGPLDISLALLISALLSLLAVRLFTPEKPIAFTEADLMASIFTQLLFGGAVLAYIILRQVPLKAFFGIGQLPFWKLLAYGAFLMAGVLPCVVIMANFLSGPDGQEQEAVKFFRETPSLQSRCLLAFMAVIIAPVVEEIVFRGLLYRVFKGYFGRIAAMFFTSVLFACIHGNIPTLLPLTLLALALTTGLELSGSLVVSIAMHASFNAVSLLLLTGEAAR